MTIPKTVIIIIIYVMVIIAIIIAFSVLINLIIANIVISFDCCHYLLFDRMVGVDWLADSSCIQARTQEACSLHPNTKHSGETVSCPRRQDAFPGTPGDRKQGSGDGCRMWFVNSWAMGWSRDM
jgi:hypothetical protein